MLDVVTSPAAQDQGLLVQPEQRHLARDHPREGVERMYDPVLVGDDRDPFERRVMVQQGAKAEQHPPVAAAKPIRNWRSGQLPSFSDDTIDEGRPKRKSFRFHRCRRSQ